MRDHFLSLENLNWEAGIIWFSDLENYDPKVGRFVNFFCGRFEDQLPLPQFEYILCNVVEEIMVLKPFYAELWCRKSYHNPLPHPEFQCTYSGV